MTTAPRLSKSAGPGGETVVLGGDGNLAGLEVLHRLVGPAVAELELEGLAAEGQAHELVAETNAEHRFLPQALADIVDAVGHRRGVAGAVA